MIEVGGKVYSVIQRVYDSVLRERLPRTWTVSGDISTRKRRLLDITDAKDIKVPLREGVRDATQPGDTVVIVGGGWGTSTVAASRAAGENGRVIVFEAVGEQLRLVQEAVAHNHTEAPVKSVHAAVGPVTERSVAGYGAPDGESVAPTDLPDADVAVLDCEGAEDRIVPALAADEIVVEIHGWSELEPDSIAGYGSEFVGRENEEAAVWALHAQSTQAAADRHAHKRDIHP